MFELKGIALDHNSVFDTHISNICKTANAKVQSLNRVKSTLNKNLKYCVTLLFCQSLITALLYEWFAVKQVIEKSNKYKKHVNK